MLAFIFINLFGKSSQLQFHVYLERIARVFSFFSFFQAWNFFILQVLQVRGNPVYVFDHKMKTSGVVELD